MLAILIFNDRVLKKIIILFYPFFFFSLISSLMRKWFLVPIKNASFEKTSALLQKEEDEKQMGIPFDAEGENKSKLLMLTTDYYL